MQHKYKIHKNDNVEIIAGKDKGKRGTIVRVFEKNNKGRVIVSGCNIVKKAIKRKSQHAKPNFPASSTANSKANKTV